MNSANQSSSHRMVEMPAGKTACDILPQYSDVKREHGPIGTPCAFCAGCEKPFTAARKWRLAIRLYPINCSVPLAFLYRLCGQCAYQYRAGGIRRDSVLARVEKFVLGGDEGSA